MYKIARYMETTNTDSIAGKMKVVAMLLPDLRKIQSAVAREAAIRQISVRLQVSEKSVWEELRKAPANQRERREEENDSKQENAFPAGNIESKVEKNILHILFERPDLLAVVEEYGGKHLFSDAAASMYVDFQESIQRCGKVDSAGIPQEKSQLLADIVMTETYIKDQEKGLKDALWQLKQEQLDLEYQKLLRIVAAADKKQGQAKEEAEKLGAIKEMQDALQKMDSIRRAKKEHEISRKGE